MRATKLPIATACRLLARGRRVSGMARAAADGVDRQAVPQQEKPMIVIVTGPTGVGKTQVGLELAQRLGATVTAHDMPGFGLSQR